MKAPDKIYVGLEDVGSGYVWDVSILDNAQPSYIRKDALLEWAEALNECGATLLAVDTLIDKLNTL